MWKAQILAVLCGTRLVGHVTSKTPAPAKEVEGAEKDGKKTTAPNPAIEEWYATDQQVLGLLLSSLSREILAQVASTWRPRRGKRSRACSPLKRGQG